MKEKRMLYLDYARGFSMLLVIYAHILITQTSPVRIWIYSFHMPIFFIITGILNYKRNKKFDIKKQFKSLMIPYFLFSFINTILLIPLDYLNHKNIINNIVYNFKNIFLLYGVKATWFLPCLLIALIIFNYLKKKNLKKENLVLILFLVFFIPYIKINVDDIATYKVICRSLIATVFLFSGYYIGQIVDKIEIKKIKLLLLLLGTVIFSFILGPVDLCYLQLSDPIMYYISALTGSMFVLLLFKYFDDKKIKLRLLEYIGKNSLTIFGTHMIIIYYVKKIVNYIFKSSNIISNQYIFSIIVFIVTLLIDVLIVYIYNIIRKKFVGGCICRKKK